MKFQKYNFEEHDSSSETETQGKKVDGNLKYLSSPKHAKDNKTDFLRFRISTPEYEINYGVENFGNSSSISFNSMNSMKQTRTTDSQKEIEPESDISIEARLDTSFNTDLNKQTSESGSAKMSDHFAESKEF
ncbi:hypothetical protein CEXT_63051 [Caerostris extrusa]|uniref:Uncharacterized protein n=1 Tax=Caerostris extrusa TaxID=172846 RepID=A0AAV4PPE1_CAEEX|nr:hypothetical protein CEXT_63051 [Caerostris extrusa]